MTKVPAIITANSITVTDPVNFVPKSIPSSHPNFTRIKELLMQGASWSALEPLVDLPKAVTTFMEGHVTVDNGVLRLNGQPIHNGLSRKILDFIGSKQEGLAKPLIAFLENVQQNGSNRAVEGLYDWLERSNLPITPDGHILAWKIVRNDYKDIHSGKFDNSVGRTVEVPRNAVDDNPDRTCSHGLHFCSSGYLPHYGTSAGNRVVVVKIHPKDVVAFPRDYDTAKGRCCKYVVVGEVPRDKAADEFFGGAKVYGEFETVSEPETNNLFPLQEGQIVQLRNGQTGRVKLNTASATANIIGADGRAIVIVFTATGSGGYRSFPLEREHDQDVVRGLFPLQVGDKVKLRDGRTAVVEAASQGGTARLSEGHYVWTNNGRGSNAAEAQYDVVDFDTPFEVKAGGRFKTRKGDTVTVTRNNHALYVFKGSNGLVYTAKGEYLEGVETDNDLVSLA